MRDKGGLISSAITVSLMLALSVLQTACTSISIKEEEKIDKKSAQSTSTTNFKVSASDKKIAEQRQGFYLKTEAMDFFFRTFFSGNLIAAYQATSLEFHKAHPFEKIDLEWREFYAEVKANSMNWKNLSYRTGAQLDDGDDSGIVISPSGRMIMKVHLRRHTQTNPNSSHEYWAVDDVLLFREALSVKSENGKERTVLTNQPEDETYKQIYALLIKEIAIPAGFTAKDVTIKRLVVSDGWARAILGVNKPGYESEQIILRREGQNWRIVSSGTGITYNDYPDSPYMLWVKDDWK